jgi:hypothetical protein
MSASIHTHSDSQATFKAPRHEKKPKREPAGGYAKTPHKVRHALAKHATQYPHALFLVEELVSLSRLTGEAVQTRGQLSESLGGAIGKRQLSNYFDFLQKEGWLVIRTTTGANFFKPGAVYLALEAEEKARQEALEAERNPQTQPEAEPLQPIAQQTPEIAPLVQPIAPPPLQPTAPLNTNSFNTLQTSKPKQDSARAGSLFVDELVNEINKKLPYGQAELRASSLKLESLEAFKALESTHTAEEAAARLLDKANRANAKNTASFLNSPAGAAIAGELIPGKVLKENNRKALEADKAAEAELLAQIEQQRLSGELEKSMKAAREAMQAALKLHKPAA